MFNRAIKKIDKCGIAIVMIAFVALIYTVKLSSTEVIDLDILWHYKLGEQIFNTHSISMDDTFSWQTGLRWNQQEWLFDLLLYCWINLTQSAGFIGLMFVTKCIIMGLSYKENKQYIDNPGRQIIFGLALFILILFPKNVGNRPSEYSTYIIVYALYNIAIKNRVNYKQAIILGILLANIHGGTCSPVVIMLAVIVVVQLYFVITKSDGVSISDVTGTLKYIAGFMAGSLINPSGAGVYKMFFYLMGLESSKYISEWDRFTPSDINIVFILLVIAAIASSGDFKERRFRGYCSLAMVCMFTVMMFMSARNGQYFEAGILFFGVGYLIDFIADIFNKLLDSTWISRVNSFIKRKVTPSYVIVPVLVFIITFIAMDWNENKLPKMFVDFVNEHDGMDDGVIAYLKEEGINDNILNDYTDGNILLFNGIKCFIDSRQIPYDEAGDSLIEFMRATRDGRGARVFWDFVDEYGFEYIVIPEDNFNVVGDFDIDLEKWEVVYESEGGGGSRVLERRHSVD